MAFKKIMFVQEFADILRSDNTIVKIARSCLAWRLESVKGDSQAYCKLTSVPFPAQNRHLLLFFCKPTDRIFIENLPYFLDLGSSLNCVVIISHQSRRGEFLNIEKEETSVLQQKWPTWLANTNRSINSWCRRNAVSLWWRRAGWPWEVRKLAGFKLGFALY